MATYIIGDLHGCYKHLNLLLDKIEFSTNDDTLWFVGDLINRGPNSLETLQMVIDLETKGNAKIVLGNHDFHLLAIYSGFKKFKSKMDNLDSILNHKKFADFVDWTRAQPLIHRQDDKVMVHAGIFPGWSIDEAEKLAAKVSALLKDKDWQDFIKYHLFDDKPKNYEKCQTEEERLRFTVNSFTRMRFLTKKNTLDFKHKGNIRKALKPDRNYHLTPNNLYPWFDLPHKREAHKVFFGHWSQIGGLEKNGVFALDTNVLWTGKLSCYQLETNKWISVQDEKYF